MAGESRDVKVRLSVESAQAIRGLEEFGNAAEKNAGKAQRAGVNSDKALRQIGVGSRNIAIAGAAALGVIEKANIGFDKTMSGVDAATHETAKNMGLLREAAIQAGADTAFSASEAAQGITELAKAGVSTKAVLGGGLKGALDLAAAGQISVAEAAETAASAMTQFRLQGKDVPHIADLLAAGAGKAQGSVHDLGQALNQSGLVAAQTGLSIEDTTGTLAAFASAGLVGSDAGTSFKTMLLSLNPRSTEAAKLMKKLNIEAYDAQGNFIGIEKYAGKLRAGLKDLSSEQRAAALKTIFGNDAIRAANLLYRNGEKGISGWVKKVNDSGYAAETAGRQLDNLAGDYEKLTGSLETAFIKGGSGAQDALRDIVQGVDGLVNKFNELPAAVQGNVVKSVAALTGLSAGVYGVTKLVQGYRAVKDTFGLGKSASAAARAGSAVGVQKVFVVNPGFGGVPGSGPGKGVPPVVPGTVTTTAGGLKGFLAKYGPAAAVAGGSFAGLGLLAAGTTLGARNNEVSKPGRFFDGSKKITAANITPKQLAQLSEAQKRMLGIDEAAMQLGKSALTVGLQVGKMTQQLGTVPPEVRTVINTPGALKSVQDVRDLKLLYKLTPKQVRTVMELKGFSETQQRIVAAGGAYKRLPKSVRTKVETPGVVNSLADVAKLQRRYRLTPAQVRTLMQVTGTEPAARKVVNLRAEIARIKGKTAQMSERGAVAARARVASLRAEIARLSNKTVTITYNGRRTGVGSSGRVATVNAHGNLYRAYAKGDIANGHQAEIAPGSKMHRVWAEEETGGEAYIPFANDSRRPRARAIAAEAVRILGGAAYFAAGGTVGASGAVTGGRPGDAVSVTFPTPVILKAAVAAAEQIAVAAKEAREANLEDLRTQQQIRDLQRDLNRRGRGRLTGLDRTIAKAELANTKASLEELRNGYTATQALRGDIFARGSGGGSAVASVTRQIADISAYGSVFARLKSAGASTMLLAEVKAKAESGDMRSAIRLGNALLAQPALLGQLNASLSTLGQVSSSVGILTSNPTAANVGAFTAAGQTAARQVAITIAADPSTWMTEMIARTKYAVLQEMAG